MSTFIVQRFADRIGYSAAELEMFQTKAHRVRHIQRLAGAAHKYSIAAEVVRARHCNSGHHTGQKMIMDIDGNFLCTCGLRKMCVYLISQLVVPVALINERLSEGQAPNDFHFMRYIRCLDVGVECLGYGEVMAKIEVIPRVK